jgi:hypothetical protein
MEASFYRRNIMRAAARLSLLVPGLFLILASTADAAKPAAQYWMSVSTDNMSVPGMEGASGGGLEGMMGSMMMKGMGVGAGTQHSFFLDLLGPDTPASPGAEHLIPPGMKMGTSLPLRYESAPGGAPVGDSKREDIKILLYWGCGDQVRMGQPRVLDTAKMSPEDYASVGVARGGGSGSRYRLAPRKGWTYGEWPNRDDRQSVPNDGSLVGAHVIKGNYTPDITFTLDEKHDFMAPVVFTRAEGGLADAVKLEWKPIPTAIGYFMMAVGGSDSRKEVVIWTSSELQDLGGGLMTWLPNATVQKYIQQKVVMKPGTTACTIPKGIFAKSEGAAVQFIAYGGEANFAYPPKPADPKAKWEPIWTAKVRLKSTGMLPLGTEGGAAAPAPAAEQPKQESTPVDSAVEGVKKLKGLFGF